MLFSRALDCLDTIPSDVPPVPWTLGGGTVLMLRYQHRLSKDIDVFLGDPQYLGFLTPRLNDTIAGWVSDWEEGPGWLKLAWPEGEVDFIASPPLTEDPAESWVLQGRPVAVETSGEIIAKKLYHRAASLQVRDVFDIAVVQSRSPNALWAARETWSERLPALRRRMQALRAQYPVQASALTLLPAGEPYRQTAWRIAHQFLVTVERTAQRQGTGPER